MACDVTVGFLNDPAAAVATAAADADPPPEAGDSDFLDDVDCCWPTAAVPAAAAA